MKSKIHLKIGGEGGTWITFRYERLMTFFFLCGIIGHDEKFCKKNSEVGEGVPSIIFGPELRAISKREQQLAVGTKWLKALLVRMAVGEVGKTPIEGTIGA